MKQIRRIGIVLLCILLLGGCVAKQDEPTPSEEPTVEAQATPTFFETQEPTEAPTPEPTPEPTEEPIYAGSGDEAFLALDRELFVWYVSQDVGVLDQYCEDPQNFGIDATTLPVSLGSLTEESEAEWADACAQWLDRLHAVDRESLSDTLAFAYDNYVRYFEREIAEKDLFYCIEPLAMVNGTHLNLPFTFALYQFRNERDIQNYFTLMNDVPRYLGEVLAFEQERAERGLFMTSQMLDTILSDLQKIAESGETSFLHGTFREQIEKADFLTDEQREAYIAENDTLVSTVWVDSYQALYDGLKQLRPRCRARVGAFEQGGDAYTFYCETLKSAAAGNRSVEDEIALLETTMSTVWSEFLFAVTLSYQSFINGETITTGSIDEDVEYLQTLMPKIVPPMPEVEVTYTEVPKELQDSYSPASYFRPSFDHYEHNTIMINPSKTCDLFTIAHEGYPGHMFQFTYQHALGTVPMFLILIESKGYSESWSTNAELNIARINDRFGKDLSVAMQLEDRISSILAMLCSLKINGQGAKKEEIREYLSQWMLADATDEIYDRAIDMPTYYFKYAGGFCELFDLTNRMKKRVGIDLVYIYTEFLRWGPGDYDLLNERMEAWAKAQ